MNQYMYPLIGGILISISSSVNLYLKGRITGFSGALYAVVNETKNFWRWSLLLGLITSTLVCKINYPYLFDSKDQFATEFNCYTAVIAGLLIGFGTKLANGCTSGHGVCGLPRFSIRSYVSVFIFTITAIGTSTLRYYYPFLVNKLNIELIHESELFLYCCLASALVVTVIMLIYSILNYSKDQNRIFSDFIVSYFVGFLFGCGLSVSGMIKRSKVLGFLVASSNWDPTLLILLVTTVGINKITFYLILKTERPVFSDDSMSLPTNTNIDANLIIGSLLFGIGWGLTGLCPGPVIASFFIYAPISILFLFFIITGQFLGGKLLKMQVEPNTKKGELIPLQLK